MSLATLLERFSGAPALPPIDIDGQQDQRRALIARAQRMAVTDLPPVADPVRDRQNEAATFVLRMARFYGLVGMQRDLRSVDMVDAFIDAARSTRPHVLTASLRDDMTSWLGEFVRYEYSMRWTDEGLLTDGRVAYDPAAAIAARSASADAPLLSASIQHAIAMAEIDTMRAA